jgi:ABC-type bacteriocin/lantibiotic exporter with double-glycine peptidase domain
MMKGIKTIKFNSWERYIYKKLDLIREDEYKLTKKLFTVYGLNNMITNFIPTIVGLFSFWLYNAYYEPLSQSKIFSILAMFNSIANPVKYLMACYTYDLRVKLCDGRLGELKGLRSEIEGSSQDDSLQKGEI